MEVFHLRLFVPFWRTSFSFSVEEVMKVNSLLSYAHVSLMLNYVILMLSYISLMLNSVHQGQQWRRWRNNQEETLQPDTNTNRPLHPVKHKPARSAPVYSYIEFAQFQIKWVKMYCWRIFWKIILSCNDNSRTCWYLAFGSAIPDHLFPRTTALNDRMPLRLKT
jgi:hypothetical protein